MLLENLQQIIISDCRLSMDRPTVVGVSGGADSLCLLGVLHQLGFPVIAAHYNHLLREGAQADESAVREIANKFQVRFESEQGKVADFAREERLSIEEAARIMRYRFLFRVAGEQQAQAVAVGHTADDQVETVLMHLLRGSGLAGLKGMDYYDINPSWSSDIPIVRPLLWLRHADTLTYCAEQNLNPLIDQTNFDPSFRRNRIRQELIPNLETYNPKIREAIWRMAVTIKGDFQLIEESTGVAWKDLILSEEPQRITFIRDIYIKLPTAVQRQVLIKAIEKVRSRNKIDLGSIERGRIFINTHPLSGSTDLTSRVTLKVDEKAIRIFAWEAPPTQNSYPLIANHQSVWLPIPGSLDLPLGWRIEAELSSARQIQVHMDEDPYQASLNFDRLTTPLSIRTRKPGDRWQPFGLIEGRQKISDFFINEKLEASVRDNWPLICSGDEIVWIPGYRIAHPFRVTPDCERQLNLRLLRQLP